MNKILSNWMLLFAFAGLAATFLAPVIVFATPALRRMRKPIAVFAGLLTLYAGAKHIATITFPTIGDAVSYLQDRGSYVTNDYIHVDFTTVVIPQTANLFVYRRQIDSTNDVDWTEHLATTIGEFNPPQDIQFASATNYNWMVFSDWTPGPAVETNGVWHAYWGLDQQRHSKLIPIRTMIRVDNDIIATPGSKPYDAEVEWLTNMGQQSILLPNSIVKDCNSLFMQVRIDDINGRNFLLSSGFGSNAYFEYYNKFQIEFNGTVITDALTINDVLLKSDGYSLINGRQNTIRASNVSAFFQRLGSSDLHVGGHGLYSSHATYYSVSGNNFNLIPVRITNELGETEGAMYDRVSGQLFRNQGTGKFVIGPDKH